MESLLTPYGLSNSDQVKLQFTPFCGGPKLVRSDGLRARTIESHQPLVRLFLGFVSSFAMIELSLVSNGFGLFLVSALYRLGEPLD